MKKNLTLFFILISISFSSDDDSIETLKKEKERIQTEIKVKDNKIVDTKFKTFGCGSAIATSSLATEWVKGKTLDEAMKVENTELVEELSLPPVKIHCSVLAEDAIKAAIADYKEKQTK